VRDVGDGHVEPVSPAFLCETYRVVEIPGVLAVDGDVRKVALVHPRERLFPVENALFPFGEVDGPRDATRLLRHRVGERHGKVHRGSHREEQGFHRVGFPEEAHHAGAPLSPRRGVFRDLREDQISRLRRRPFREVDFEEEVRFPVAETDEMPFAARGIPSDERPDAARKDPLDPAVRRSTASPAFEAHHHAVFRPGTGEGGPGDAHRGTTRVVGDDEGTPLPGETQPPLDGASVPGTVSPLSGRSPVRGSRRGAPSLAATRRLLPSPPWHPLRKNGFQRGLEGAAFPLLHPRFPIPLLDGGPPRLQGFRPLP